jgi:hypothetical protein
VPVGQEQGNRTKEDSGLLRALEFLDTCLLPEPNVERSPPPPEVAKPAPVADPAASPLTVDDPGLRPTPLGSMPEVHVSRFAGFRIPHGLLYWFGVGVAAGTTWRLTSSLYEMTIAALVASAALIGLELLLRTVDPRLARRLGFARMHRRATFYGAGAVLGVGSGLVAAHFA